MLLTSRFYISQGPALLRCRSLHYYYTIYKEVKERPDERLVPDKAPYFALGTRLNNEFITPNKIELITSDYADMPILDTASFVILSTIMQQAISEAINESINQAIIDNYPEDIQNALLARGIPIREGTPSYFAKQRLLEINGELLREKQKKYDNIAKMLNPPPIFGPEIGENPDIHIPEVFSFVRQYIKEQSSNVIVTVETGASFEGFDAILTVPDDPHQGIFGFGWSN